MVYFVLLERNDILWKERYIIESDFITSVLMTFMYNVYTVIQKTCPHVYGVTYNTTNIIWESFKILIWQL